MLQDHMELMMFQAEMQLDANANGNALKCYNRYAQLLPTLGTIALCHYQV